jgi:hypothetical protein
MSHFDRTACRTFVKLAESRALMAPLWRCLPWLALLFIGCLDPLYQELPPSPGPQYSVCCVAGYMSTCLCATGQSCDFGYLACAEGMCVPAPGGVPSEPCPAGITPDAGGVAPDAGNGAPPPFAACCDGGVVDTCACPDTSCSAFTPCAGGVCVSGSTRAACP